MTAIAAADVNASAAASLSGAKLTELGAGVRPQVDFGNDLVAAISTGVKVKF